MYPRVFTITVGGDSQEDICIALQEVHRLVGEGYTSGLGDCEEGNFQFESTEVQEV
jgi:hypothetical protein